VVAAVHLDLRAGWRANPAGLLAVAVGVALVVFPRIRRVTLPGWVVPAALAVMWLWELVRFGVL
jgi:hypothetical protein